MHKRYNSSVKKAEIDINNLLDEKNDDKNKIAGNDHTIRDNQETDTRMCEDHDFFTHKKQDYINMRIEHHKIKVDNMMKVIDGLNLQIGEQTTIINTQKETEERLRDKLQDVTDKLNKTVKDIHKMKKMIEDK